MKLLVELIKKLDEQTVNQIKGMNRRNNKEESTA